jgi:copper(I)-binding protein
MLRIVPILVLALLVLPAAVLAHSAKLDQISIGHAWAPPTAEEAGAVYMPLLNDGDGKVRLVALSAPVAESIYLRKGKGGNAERLESVTLQPGQPLAMAEWREHVWLEGLKRPLEEGERFPLTLTFEPAGEVTIDVIVESAPGH